MSVQDVSGLSLSQLLSLEGRAAVVTGAAKGIGAAIADRLAEAGAHLLLGDVDDAGVAAVAERILRTDGAKAVPVLLDVRNSGSVAAAADRCVAEFGRLDIWVNNAGIFPTSPVLDMTDAQWDLVLDVNLRGAFLGAREAGRCMVAGGHGGVIVNVASTAAYRAAGPGLAHYVSSKHGLVGLTKSLAVELGPHGIRVLAVAPTLIETPGVQQLAAGSDEAMRALLEQLSSRLPLGRAGVPDDVARVVLVAVSDAAMLMTGSVLDVDAGDLSL